MKAHQTGIPVEVADRQDETTELVANPDGSFTLRRHARPVRAKVAGQWQSADATLERRGDGSIAPKASVFPMTFSAGGSAPLATMQKDGKSLAITWPTPLPQPELSGSTALYREVMPGVDLKVLAEADGFAHQLVVKTREAADDPRLARISYGLKTAGITLTSGQDGRIAGTDGTGNTVFTAEAPRMWDSHAPAEASRQPAAAPSSMAKNAPAAPVPSKPVAPGPAEHAPKTMATEITTDTLRLTPDADLLHGADTVFPVVIDPTFTDGWRNRWAVVYSATPNEAYPDGNGWHSDNPADEPRVGYNGSGNTRSYFEMNTSGLAGARIMSATFHAEETHSWTCNPAEAGNTELWATGLISGTTPTWNNQAPWIWQLDAKAFAHGNPGYCPGTEGVDFSTENLRAVVQGAADRGDGSVTLGLRTPDSYLGNKYSYKRFKNNPWLEVTYNRPPVLHDYAGWEAQWTPGSSSNVNVPCISDPAAWPTIGRNDLVMTARISDPDNDSELKAKFEAWDHDTGQYILVDRASAPNGTWAIMPIGWAKMRDGGRYKWHAQAEDGLDVSGFGRDCGFNVDGTPPTKPTVTSADGHRLDTPEVPARTPRTIKFASSDQFGLKGFCYSLNKPLPVVNQGCGGTWVDAGPDGTATVTVTPTIWPTNRLTVQAVDKGGNLSPYDGSDGGPNSSTTLITTAASNWVHDATDPALVGDRPGDLTGDGHADLVAATSTGELVLYTGRGDGTFDQPRTIANPGWSGAQIVHRGDFTSQTPGQTKDGYEDFLVKQGTRLYLYPGTGMGAPDEGKRTELLHPSGGDWSGTSQIVAPGNIDDMAGNDLITKDGDALVLYSGTAAGPLAAETGTNRLKPGTVVSSAGWADYDVLAPGDVNGDGIPDLLARRNTTDPADPEYGRIRLVLGARNSDGHGYRAGDPAAGAVYATGFDPQHKPLITTPGNLHGSVADSGKGYPLFTPTPGQATGDVLAMAPADPAAVVTHYGADGSAQTTTCPTGCLLMYPGTPTGLGLPRLVGQGNLLHVTTALDGGQSLRSPATSMTRAANGTLVAVKANTDGSLSATNQTTPTGGFRSWYALSGPGVHTGDPAPILSPAAGGTVHIFARTRAGRIVDYAQAGPDAAFSPSVVIGSSAPVFAQDPAVNLTANGSMIVTAIDTAGDLWATNQSSPGTPFGTWYKVSASGGLTGHAATVRSPAGGGTLNLFARTTNGHIGYFGQSSSTSGFSAGDYLGANSPVFAGDPSVTTSVSGGMIVAAIDVNGDVWAIDQAAPGTAFRSWYRITPGGGTGGATGIVLSAGAGGTVNIVARTADGHIALFGQGSPTSGFSSGTYLGNPNMTFAGDPRILLFDNGAMVVTTSDAAGTTWAIDQPAPGASFRSWYQI
ncbi:FG-GAP-like repeat-containing protein [Kitasatospora brasiliensis]|uniref:FG-GAP-like repeat-containing protein n=1 Tax=Kitasatospora brasiliensis TaxID=3058040 RepID=UPI00292DC3A6|nr:FG-GAP-like repeat-containing protein [Kitasatospora sp. K002]